MPQGRRKKISKWFQNSVLLRFKAIAVTELQKRLPFRPNCIKIVRQPTRFSPFRSRSLITECNFGAEIFSLTLSLALHFGNNLITISVRVEVFGEKYASKWFYILGQGKRLLRRIKRIKLLRQSCHCSKSRIFVRDPKYFLLQLQYQRYILVRKEYIFA